MRHIEHGYGHKYLEHLYSRYANVIKGWNVTYYHLADIPKTQQQEGSIFLDGYNGSYDYIGPLTGKKWYKIDNFLIRAVEPVQPTPDSNEKGINVETTSVITFVIINTTGLSPHIGDCFEITNGYRYYVTNVEYSTMGHNSNLAYYRCRAKAVDSNLPVDPQIIERYIYDSTIDKIFSEVNYILFDNLLQTLYRIFERLSGLCRGDYNILLWNNMVDLALSAYLRDIIHQIIGTLKNQVDIYPFASCYFDEDDRLPDNFYLNLLFDFENFSSNDINCNYVYSTQDNVLVYKYLVLRNVDILVPYVESIHSDKHVIKHAAEVYNIPNLEELLINHLMQSMPIDNPTTPFERLMNLDIQFHADQNYIVDPLDFLDISDFDNPLEIGYLLHFVASNIFRLIETRSVRFS